MSDRPIDKNRANRDPQGTRPSRVRAVWESLTDEERDRRSRSFSDAQKKRWAALSPEERQRVVDNAAEARRRSLTRGDSIARAKYLLAGVSLDEAEYLLTLGGNARKTARLRQRDYGLSPLAFKAMLERQGGRCALCDSALEGRSLHVDHDHMNGIARGLLCASCNLALGHVETKGSDWIARALDYITTRGPAAAAD